MRHARPPTEITMQMVQDAAVWREANAAFVHHRNSDVYETVHAKPGAHPDDLLDERGVRVKAGYDTTHHRFRHYGALVKLRGKPLSWCTLGYELVNDEVIVLSTVDQETVWFGTVDQYHQMWCVD